MVILGYIILLCRNIILMSKIEKKKLGCWECCKMVWYINDKIDFEMVK